VLTLTVPLGRSVVGFGGAVGRCADDVDRWGIDCAVLLSWAGAELTCWTGGKLAVTGFAARTGTG
jgi:hypothetical protein